MLEFLEQLEGDLPDRLADFRPEAEEREPLAELQGLGRDERLARYEANVLVDNSKDPGAPVVIERNPTYYNLERLRAFASSDGYITGQPVEKMQRASAPTQPPRDREGPGDGPPGR